MAGTADYLSAAGGLFEAAGSLFGGLSAAKGQQKAAAFYDQAAHYAALSGELKSLTVGREVDKITGGAEADVASSGFLTSGSALDIIKASAQEGSITKSLVNMQGMIDASGYAAQAAAARAAAKGSKGGGILGAIGKVVGTVATLYASDDRLKEDIQLVARRMDGIGVYHFRYTGRDAIWEGVLASEVENVLPAAVSYDKDGYRLVNYAALGITPRIVGHRA